MQHKKHGEETWTDLSNAKIEIVPSSNTKNQPIEEATSINYSIKISNVTLDANSQYLAYFHYKDEEITNNKVMSHSHAIIDIGKEQGDITSIWIKDFLQKSGDIYVSILQRKGTDASAKNNLILTTKKIERPELLPKLGNRFNIYFDNNSTKTYFFAPNVNTKNGGTITRKLKIKIGHITDMSILKTIRDNKVKGLNDLLNYSKKANNYNYVGTIEYKGNSSGITESLTSKMNLENGEYYFAYIELDDENGVYYPVEDISLYYAKNTTDLIRYPKKEFVWNIKEDINNSEQDEQKEENKEEEPKQEPIENTIKDTTNNIEENNKQEKEDTTKAKGVLPQTGEKAIQVIVVLMIVLVAIGYYKYRQYKDIK